MRSSLVTGRGAAAALCSCDSLLTQLLEEKQ